MPKGCNLLHPSGRFWLALVLSVPCPLQSLQSLQTPCPEEYGLSWRGRKTESSGVSVNFQADQTSLRMCAGR